MPTTIVITCQAHRPATASERRLAAAGYLGAAYRATEKETTIWAAAPRAATR